MEALPANADVVPYLKPALAVITGVLGWLVKDYLFGIVSKRREVVRAEWKARLTEVWGPLYYWSGAIRMWDEKKGWDRHGVRELEDLLDRNVHLIPQLHYYNLIRLIQSATGQSTSSIDEVAYSRTRQFIYRRVEILNLLLYRQTREYDPDAYTDPLALPRALLRGMTLVFVHGIAWALVLAVPAAIYIAWTRRALWVLGAVGLLFLVGAGVEYRRRVMVHRAVLSAEYPGEVWTWKALLQRVVKSLWSMLPRSRSRTAKPQAKSASRPKAREG